MLGLVLGWKLEEALWLALWWGSWIELLMVGEGGGQFPGRTVEM